MLGTDLLWRKHSQSGIRGDSAVENVLATRLRYNVISINTLGNNVLLSGVEQTILVEPSPTKALQGLSASRSNCA